MMATGRMLRGQISVSPQVNDLSIKATLLFTWLIPHVDDFGRINAHPRRLKSIIFPMRDDITISDIDESLYQMADQGLIILYKIDNETFLQMTKFDQHQRIDKRTASKLPSPEGAFLLDSGKFREIPGNSCPREEKLREENLIEKEDMSGKPDPDFNFLKNQELKKQAVEILSFLNLKTKRKYRPVKSNLKLIIARLSSGVDFQDCKSLIARKVLQWEKDFKMKEYLRPKTLFNETNFEQYLGEMIEEVYDVPES